jgi:hypothetical protein
MDSSLNFIPKMNRETLISGYKHILNTIYAPKQYYARIKTLLKEYKPKAKVGTSQINWRQVLGLVNSMWFLGIRERGRRYYWRLFAATLVKRPRAFPMFVTLSVYGYHFRKVVHKYMGVPAKNTV